MKKLNDRQERIAAATDGVVVVDAGPGTGKTHTIVQRYMNILKKDVNPSEILMLTFTENAAAEMEERVKREMTSRGLDTGSVRSSTFDAFCLRTVMESPETVSGFFKTKETLTRGARLVQNDTLNRDYFRRVYTKFIINYGRMYGNIPAIIGTSYDDVYNIIQRLMSIGIAPMHDGGWFGRDTGMLTGNEDELMSALSPAGISKEYRNEKDINPERAAKEVTEEMIREAVRDPRKELLFFINGIYYEFIRCSVSDNRLTFGLNALFAFIVLYENKNIRKMMSFRYVMVDEFQDTNELQFLTALLILKEPNLCVVGDWKQGIYGFRYASIENMTEFKGRLELMKKFLNKGEKRIVPGITDPLQLPLTENYRSTRLVIETAFSALRCRTNDKEEIDTEWLDSKVTELTSVRDSAYTAVERISAEDEEKEILAILQSITRYVTDPAYRIVEEGKDGVPEERQPEYRDIAVLCRNGVMCTKVKEAAKAHEIPMHLQGDIDIMATREGKLALAWLRYVNNKDDLRGPVAILAELDYSLAEMKGMFPRKHGTDGVPDSIKEKRKELVRKKRRINALLTSAFDFHGLNNDITQSIISVISSAHAGGMLTVSDVIKLIESDMEKGSKYNVDALLDGRSVMVQTMHKSKGLEYPIVILGGLNTKVMPSTRNETGLIEFDPRYGVRLTKEYAVVSGHHKIFSCWKWKIIKHISGPDRNGERRLFFVALSRAKQYITMTCRREHASAFIRDVRGSALRYVEPELKFTVTNAKAARHERPDVPEYEKRKRRISLHDVMDEYEESGGGKGAEHGIRVHKDAQRIMSGMSASKNDEETRYILGIYEKVKKAKIMTEIDCSLPVGDKVIAGRIDMIAEFDDHAEIHDYKTDMNRSNEERYIMQMSVYAHSAKYLKKPVTCIIDYVSQGMSVSVEIMGVDEINRQLERIFHE